MKKVWLHREGVGLLISFFLILTLTCWVAFVFVSFKEVSILTPLVLFTVMGLALNLFCFPRRNNSEAANRRLIIAPADGKMVVMEEVEEPGLLGRRYLKPSISMSFHNVHASWVVRGGMITHVEHRNDAYHEVLLLKNSVLNEHSAVVTHMDGGHEVLERQTAGAVVRCTVTYPKVGDEVTVEDSLGFTRFGSRIDLYLPLGTEIVIRVDDEVVDGETMLGCSPQ